MIQNNAPESKTHGKKALGKISWKKSLPKKLKLKININTFLL